MLTNVINKLIIKLNFNWHFKPASVKNYRTKVLHPQKLVQKSTHLPNTTVNTTTMAAIAPSAMRTVVRRQQRLKTGGRGTVRRRSSRWEGCTRVKVLKRGGHTGNIHGRGPVWRQRNLLNGLSIVVTQRVWNQIDRYFFIHQMSIALG